MAQHSKNKWLGMRPWRRHSTILFFSGLIYIAIGVSFQFYIVGGPRWQALVVAREIMPMVGWTVVFIVAGIISCVSAVWPPYSSDTWGYSMLTGLSAAWAAGYSFGIVLGAPLANLSTSLIWFLVAFLWWSISGLVNPERRVHYGAG